MKKIYITGISGSGKTTIAKVLKEQGIEAYDLDEISNMCYWVDRVTGEIINYEAKLDRPFIEAHKWICNIERIKELTNTDELVTIFGNAENLDEIIPLFDKIIVLQCKPEIFLKRIRGRKDNDFGQEGSAQEYLEDTYKLFEKNLISKGAIAINADGTLNVVLESIIAEINK